MCRWTRADLEMAKVFYSTHSAGGTPLPWPEDLFEKIVSEHNGYFPVKVQALREGTGVHTYLSGI